MADPKPPKDAIDLAFEKNDPRPLAALPAEDLQKIKMAEDILEARFQAQKRANRLAAFGASMVGYVALAGFFANAYQNYNNKKHLEEQSVREQAKWEREFTRAQAADKYRAFFETSALVTDTANPDRRLIGYALLEEFVNDRDYHPKAVTILEESLAKELRDSEREGDGLDDARRNAVRQIVRALSASPGCEELVFAARSINQVTRHTHTKTKGTDEDARDLFSMYVRRLVGRGAIACKSESDFDGVREPIRDALAKTPEASGLAKNASLADVNMVVAQLLVERCNDELEEGAVSDCPQIRKRYLSNCEEASREPQEWVVEKKACDTIRNWTLPVGPSSSAEAEKQP